MELKKGYKQTEVGMMPEDWLVSRLGDCGEVIMGQSPPGSSYNRTGVGSPLINGPTEFTDLHPIKIQWTTQPARFCKPGDLLICVRGSSTGRTNYADDTYAIGRGVAAIRAKDKNDTQYLSYQVISGVSDILATATGSTFPSVDGASFRKIVVRLPPPPEQEAIAEALSDADVIIESLEKLIAKKRNIKQAAMQTLLTGKKRLPGFENKPESKQTEVGHIPKDWEVQSFESVLLRLNAKKHQIQTSDYQPFGKYPVIDQGKNVVVGYSDRQEKSFQCPQEGVIVFGDHTCIIKYVDFDFVVGADGTQILAAQSGQCLRFHFFQLEHKGIATTGYNRHFKFLKERLFVVPPVLEQEAIANILSDMDAEIEELEKKRDKYIMIKQGMMQELLTGKTRLI